MCTGLEEQECGGGTGEESGETLSLNGLKDKNDNKSGWALREVTFTTNGCPGKCVYDTGADVTVLSHSYAEKAGITVNKQTSGITSLKSANGDIMGVVGKADLDITIQVVLDTGNGVLVHWDRSVRLKNVLVVDMATPPRDLYIAYKDWAPGKGEQGALASLASLVLSGAKVYDTPRVPEHGSPPPERVVVAMLGTNDESGSAPNEPGHGPPTPTRAEAAEPGKDGTKSSAPPSAGELLAFEQKCWGKIDTKYKDTAAAKRLVAGLVQRYKLFGPHDPSELTETVEFKLKPDTTAKVVSFKVPLRSGQTEAALDGLNKWIREGVCKKVDWSTKAYGFVIIVPKPGGKFRVTVSPKSVNEATEVYEPEGGYMPDSMAHAAQRVGLLNVGFMLDFTEAFTTLKLGPEAQRLSVFTSPMGKVQFERGWFGYHSFPGLWQTTVMERVVLPTFDKFVSRGVALENWVDDLLGGAKDPETLVDMLLETLDAIMAIGGRLSIDKCKFMSDTFDYCGIQIYQATHTWKVAPARVESLAKLPNPKDHEALRHVLGVYRYYFFATHDQVGQRQRIETLSRLDYKGVCMAREWTDEHTKIMANCAKAVIDGGFALCFDPSKELYVTTDASGNHGYGVTAHQWDTKTGKLIPVAFYSKGWIATQLRWTPQVKECYAARQAVCVFMPKHFPYARVVLLCDNKNLSTDVTSEDHRVSRWLHDIMSTGAVRMHWLKGQFNTIADYGSRAVQADPTGQLTATEKHEMNILGLSNDETVVPGHVYITPMVAKIIEAQKEAPSKEKSLWVGTNYKTVIVGNGQSLILHNGRMVVPRDAKALKMRLMYMAHDDAAHALGGERTLWALQHQAKVFWMDMKHEVQVYVSSCPECQLIKTPHGAPGGGTLQPTHALRPHDTWYADIKGPMPKDHKGKSTGYILLTVDAFSRVSKLRYLPQANGKEVIEEMEEIILSFGTRPRVLRTDGGQPFDSKELKEWCAKNGIELVKGLPDHSRGQGMVETRFRTIANAIMTTLGGKAPEQWWQGGLLARIESILNDTYVEPIGGSPNWVLTGMESRTRTSTQTDWTSPAFGAAVLGMPGVDFDTYNDLITRHHEAIAKIQGRAGMASNLASAVTKTDWSKTHKPHEFKVGDWVVLHTVAPNRMAPHFKGPYKVITVGGDGNTVVLAHYLTMTVMESPVHAARLLHFDMSRTTPERLALFQLGEGNGIVESIEEHRQLADGSHEFKIKWLGHPVPTWVDGKQLSKVVKAIQYCEVQGLPAPGKGGSKKNKTTVRFTESALE